MLPRCLLQHTTDKFYHLAKEQGYRSRAAFKLVQLNKKYDFLSKASSLLDLCAAPGGWLQARWRRLGGPHWHYSCSALRRLAPWLTRPFAAQVAHKYMPLSSTIVGVDLVPIRPIRGVVTLTEDITTAKCRAAVKRCLPPGGLFDVVICDGAPNVGGAWSAEAYTQAALVLEACKLACDVLAPKGLFITKVFRSAEYHALLYTFHQLFERVESTKPLASRSTSAEIYVACIGYRAPGKLDKRLLDPTHLFASTEGGDGAGDAGQGASGKPSVLDVPDGETRRNRGGYDTATGTLFTFGDAEADFVSSDKPVEALGAFNLFRIAPGSELDVHEATTGEVRSLIADLRVLGKRDFRALLKWRDGVRRTRAAEAKAAAAAAEAADGAKAAGEADAGDEEDKLLAEMEEVRERAERRKRREKKTKAKAKTKARVRAALGANGDANDVYGHDNELFALKRVTGGKAGLERVADKATGDSDGDDSEDELRALAAEQSDEEDDAYGDDDGEEDPDRVADEVLLNRELDAMYAAYATRRGLKHTGEVVVKRRSRASLKDAGELAGDMDGDIGEDTDDFDWRASGKELAKRTAASAAEAAASRNPLVLSGPKGKAQGGSLADIWFSNPVFDDIIRGSTAQPAAGRVKPAKRKQVAAAEEDEEEEDAIRTAARAAARGWEASGGDKDEARPKKAASGRGGTATRGEDTDFEIVPQRADDGSDSDSDRSTSYDREMDETLDDGTKAEIRAMGRLLMRRKTREALTEEGYHKWTSGSQEELPPWFAADEARHCRRNLPVTAAEVAAEKAALRALDARPIKKVAEARARKKRKLAVRMDQARSQANAIADQEDVPLASRMRQIERVYAKSRRGKGGPTGKGGKGGKDAKGSSKSRLDPRMRKDQRQVGSKKKAENAKRKGKGGRGKGGGGKKR